MRENVSNVKEEKDQTTRPCHDSPSVSSVFERKRRKFSLKFTPVYSSNIRSFNFSLANTAGCVVSFLALLIVVLCRMFSHHVCLEIRGLSALEVAVSTGKRLLTSVRSHVYV